MSYQANPLTSAEFHHNNPDSLWTPGLGALHADFKADSFSAAAALAARFAEEADRVDHHPNLALFYPGVVRVSISTHAIEGLSDLDESLAAAFSMIAAQAGATQHTVVMTPLEIALDTMDADRIKPFWLAVTGYRQDRYGNLVDPAGLGSSIWFQQMSEPRSHRNRIHFDITVPPDEADQRVAAAIAAGGTLVSDSRARAFWILADADGNEVCICTWQDRDY